MLLATFREIKHDNGVRLYDAAAGEGVDPEGDTLPGVDVPLT